MKHTKHSILPVEKVEEVELWMEQKCRPLIGNCKSEEEMAERLHLKVEFVPPNRLSPHVEAELSPIEDPNFQGVIRINSEYQNNAFSYLHEIMHYLIDVGAGNQVQQTYTRKSTGCVDSDHDQEINYAMASFMMPYAEMLKAIENYDKNKFRMNEIKFVSDLARKYRQSDRAIIHRIQEVRRYSLSCRN